jgi:hypothetical protein
VDQDGLTRGSARVGGALGAAVLPAVPADVVRDVFEWNRRFGYS